MARDVKAHAGDAQKGIKENTPWIEVTKKQKRASMTKKQQKKPSRGCKAIGRNLGA